MGIEDRIAQLRQKALTKPRKKWYQKWWGVLLIVFSFFIISCVGAAAIYVFQTAIEINQDKYLAELKMSDQVNQTLAEGSGQNYTFGTSSPKITIVEFSDFACPFCKESAPVIRELGYLYKDQIKIIYRDLIGHAASLDLALAARCAGEQGKFWEMHDAIFAQQDTLKLGDLGVMAEELGVNKIKFNQCFSSQKYMAHVQADWSDAQKLNVTSTPTWIINNYKVSGAIPKENFIKIIEQLLKK